jgi:uncharacterized membrane protein YeaQ/YmgE (transglycosylase-associated protein family)
MTMETFLLWMAIGAIAGFLASAIVGGGYGLIGDIIIGVVGAFVGGWLFRALGWHAPFTGMAGTVVIAFIGALVLLLILRVLRVGTARRI